MLATPFVLAELLQPTAPEWKGGLAAVLADCSLDNMPLYGFPSWPESQSGPPKNWPPLYSPTIEIGKPPPFIKVHQGLLVADFFGPSRGVDFYWGSGQIL